MEGVCKEPRGCTDELTLKATGPLGSFWHRPAVHTATAIGLSLYACLASATWERLDGWDIYVNTAEISEFKDAVSGDRVLKLWTRNNLDSPIDIPGEGLAHSVEQIFLIECERRVYTFGFTFYDGRGSTGRALASQQPPSIKFGDHIRPDSRVAALADRYCKKGRWQFWRR